ncbi:hypothetical protein EG329_011490 [Mollisiaceae sp. DMI_Dod_QoI]|nr:hypothetical protein EG329_011490 [Helotiales sp. DMI_Dod_QoI]
MSEGPKIVWEDDDVNCLSAQLVDNDSDNESDNRRMPRNDNRGVQDPAIWRSDGGELCWLLRQRELGLAARLVLQEVGQVGAMGWVTRQSQLQSVRGVELRSPSRMARTGKK